MKRLRLLRKSKGWTQEQLAVRAGVASATVSNLERGITTGMTPILRVLAFELESDPARLLDDIDEPATACG